MERQEGILKPGSGSQRAALSFLSMQPEILSGDGVHFSFHSSDCEFTECVGEAQSGCQMA